MSSDRSLCSACMRTDAKRSFNSRGRMVRRLIVPPTVPSTALASGTLVTCSEEISDAGKS